MAELSTVARPYAEALFEMCIRDSRIGLDGRQPFSDGRLSPAVQQALTEAQPLAGRRIADGVSRLATPMNGWNTVLTGIGTYGTDYTRRAAIAYACLLYTSRCV